MKKWIDFTTDLIAEKIGLAPDMAKKMYAVLGILFVSNIISFLGGKSIGETKMETQKRSPVVVNDILPEIYSKKEQESDDFSTTAENELVSTSDTQDINEKIDTSPNLPKENRLFGSKKGKKFYYAGCSGAGRIKPENKIYFKNEEEAKIRGYTKAKGCT
jgi:hypothetical protein